MFNPVELSARIKQKAYTLGFDLVGITSAAAPAHADYLRAWLEAGKHGSMAYLANRFEIRTDPTQLLSNAKSVVCVAINYNAKLEESQQSLATAGRIAKYALGNDYHDLIKSRLFALADWVRTVVPEAQTKCAVDTAPIFEKELAARAGIGWMGKNTCIINERIGSWVLLGEMLTTIELPVDDPAIDRCGSCTRCIEACPTQAITDEYQLDAARCISYLTIENRGEIAEELKPLIGDWLYGCDICQDVCPWNRKAPMTIDPAFEPRFPSGTAAVEEIAEWTPVEYSTNLRGSAMKRVKLPILQRNARIVLDNKNKAPG